LIERKHYYALTKKALYRAAKFMAIVIYIYV